MHIDAGFKVLPEVSDYTQLINLGGPADYRLPEVVEFREIATDVVLREVSLIPASLREGLETQRRLLDLMKDYLSPDQFSQLYDRHLKYQVWIFWTQAFIGRLVGE